MESPNTPGLIFEGSSGAQTATLNSTASEKPPVTNPLNELIERTQTKEPEKTTAKKILLFGQGPVINSESRLKSNDPTNTSGSEAINFWSEDIVKAAVELYRQDPNTEFIVMGGQTGGDAYKSEAYLIGEMLQKEQIPAGVIRLEQQSSDTVENIVNYLNLYSDKQKVSFDAVCAPYHTMRLKLLTKLFNIQTETIYRSDAVLRESIGRNFDWTQSINSEKNRRLLEQLNELDNRLDLNDVNPNPDKPKKTVYFDKQKGTEQRTVNDRWVTDDVLMRELIEFPEKWLSYLPRLNDDQQIRTILENAKDWYTYHDEHGQQRNYLTERLGFDVLGDIEEVKKRLKDIRYNGIEITQFNNMKADNISKSWPAHLIQIRNNILNLRE